MPNTYRVQQIPSYHDGFWDTIVDIPNMNKAIAKARRMNELVEPGSYKHRVIEVPGGKVVYERGWVKEKD